MKQRTEWTAAELLNAAGCKLVQGTGDVPVTGIEYDSRKVIQGNIFVAVQGEKSDGHDYIAMAMEKGAVAAVVHQSRIESFSGTGLSLLASTNDSRRALSRISSLYYGEPSRHMDVVGITGTNGKTSITYMLESMLTNLGRTVGVIGTVNYRWGSTVMPAPNTTPESRELQRIMAEMKDNGVDTVVMEVSSHALALGRVDDVHFVSGLFTNLTGDHLDFHRDMEDYFHAKRYLFELMTRDGNRGSAILYSDDEYGRRLSSDFQSSLDVVTYGSGSGSNLQVDESTIINNMDSLAYSFAFQGKAFHVSLNLSGRFNVYNSLGAIAVAWSLGHDMDHVVGSLSTVRCVPGRFEVQTSSLGFGVVVDYAHTGDALLKLLQSANEIDHNRIITVFGCGGDRDTSKRPVMGRIAQDYSDVAIVTSDNPRTENPAAIIDDILAGMDRNRPVVQVDREEAIRQAIDMAGEKDIVVIAGKGHEDYQILGTEKIHFDDREMARKYITMREKG